MSKKQIINGREARAKVKAGVDQVADAVKATLGHDGKNVIIAKNFSIPHITKDGYSVAKDIELPCPFENIGAQLIKEVSLKQVKEVGDGTTTSTVLAQALLNGAFDQVDGFMRKPKEVREELEKSVQFIVEKIKEASTPCETVEDLQKVATISANGDEVIGNIVGEAINEVGKDGIIVFEEDLEDSLKFEKGMSFARGGVNSHLIGEFENPAIFVSLESVDFNDLVPILEKYVQLQQPVVFVAPEYAGDTLQTITMNVMQRGFKVAAIKNPGYGKNQKPETEDFAAALGTTPYTKLSGKSPLESVGFCEKIEIDTEETKVINPKGDVTEYVKTLKDKNRIALLSNKVATIHIGAKSEPEYREKFDRYEDAVCSAKAALEEGIVKGGGQTLLNIDTGIEWINKAIHTPSQIIGEVVGDPIDPAKVTRSCIEYSSSVVSNIIMVGSLVADIEDKEKDDE